MEGESTDEIKRPMGFYLFHQGEFEVRQTKCSMLEIGYSQNGAWVSVLKVPVGKNGAQWDGGRLIHIAERSGGYPIVPGIGHKYALEYLALGTDGSLLHEWGYGERGLSLFVLPFSDYYSGRCLYPRIR